MANRQHIRELKRAAMQRQDSGALIALLQRSVRFGHKRLALLRCIQAERLGVAIAPDMLDYCRKVADQLPRATLEDIVAKAGRTGA
jgi:hypothetical protein